MLILQQITTSTIIFTTNLSAPLGPHQRAVRRPTHLDVEQAATPLAGGTPAHRAGTAHHHFAGILDKALSNMPSTAAA